MALPIDASIESGATHSAAFISLSGVSRQIILDALASYTMPYTWRPNTADEDSAQNAIDTAIDEVMTEMTPVPIGVIMPYSVPFASASPAGWLDCDGSEVSQESYAILYSLIGNTYGAAAAGYFKLPALSGRFMFGQDGNQAIDVGDTGGASLVTLNAQNIPNHAHNLVSSSGTLLYTYGSGGAGRYGLSNGSGSNPVTTRLTTEQWPNAQQQPFSIIPPYLAVRFLIKAL